MLKGINRHKAQSTIEYITLIVFVMGALLVFQKYAARAVNGRWKGVGESFGFGRQYDINQTLDCAYDYEYMNVWYNVACYEKKCDCFSGHHDTATCQTCILSCQTPECN